MKYLLDTDHISIRQRPASPEYQRLMARLGQCSPADISVSIVSFQEQVLGANAVINRARMTARVVFGYALLSAIQNDFAASTVLPFDHAAGTIFDNLRAQGVRIGTMDLRIASIALSRNLTLLTRNISDFSQVPGLVTEDWTV
jgi:tRNA(fMet)-specific endonuclease VapC